MTPQAQAVVRALHFNFVVYMDLLQVNGPVSPVLRPVLYVFWSERSLCDRSLGVVRGQVLDTMWSEFLEDMKSVDTAVHLRSFSHLNPLDEYRLEGSELLIPPPVTASLRNLRNQRKCIWRMGALSFDCDTLRLICRQLLFHRSEKVMMHCTEDNVVGISSRSPAVLEGARSCH
jgi:hypothetical protein